MKKVKPSMFTVLAKHMKRLQFMVGYFHNVYRDRDDRKSGAKYNFVLDRLNKRTERRRLNDE